MPLSLSGWLQRRRNNCLVLDLDTKLEFSCLSSTLPHSPFLLFIYFFNLFFLLLKVPFHKHLDIYYSPRDSALNAGHLGGLRMGRGPSGGTAEPSVRAACKAGTRSCSELSPISSADVSTWWSSLVSRVPWGWHGCPGWPGGREKGTGPICPAAAFPPSILHACFSLGNRWAERPRLEGEEGAERRQPGSPWLRAPWDSAGAVPWGVGPESHQTPNQEGQVESRLLIVPCALRKEAVGRLGDGGSRRQPGSAALALTQSQGCGVAAGIALPGWPRVPPPARNHVVLDQPSRLRCWGAGPGLLRHPHEAPKCRLRSLWVPGSRLTPRPVRGDIGSAEVHSAHSGIYASGLAPRWVLCRQMSDGFDDASFHNLVQLIEMKDLSKVFHKWWL